mmetsp:Transcript_7202/g.12977  ORF Transcript_7202/g.12977 Transcript_7202/m.12977 type:complete len:378 (-) Transcript_7202:490-1623(-)
MNWFEFDDEMNDIHVDISKISSQLLSCAQKLNTMNVKQSIMHRNPAILSVFHVILNKILSSYLVSLKVDVHQEIMMENLELITELLNGLFHLIVQFMNEKNSMNTLEMDSIHCTAFEQAINVLLNNVVHVIFTGCMKSSNVNEEVEEIDTDVTLMTVNENMHELSFGMCMLLSNEYSNKIILGIVLESLRYCDMKCALKVVSIWSQIQSDKMRNARVVLEHFVIHAVCNVLRIVNECYDRLSGVFDRVVSFVYLVLSDSLSNEKCIDALIALAIETDSENRKNELKLELDTIVNALCDQNVVKKKIIRNTLKQCVLNTFRLHHHAHHAHHAQKRTTNNSNNQQQRRKASTLIDHVNAPSTGDHDSDFEFLQLPDLFL